MSLISLFWLSFILAFCSGIADHHCPRLCVCTFHAVGNINCSGHGQNLTYIPQVPQGIDTIYFTGNVLQNITADTFKNISVFHYHLVDLSNNSMETIQTGAFSAIKDVKNLKLCGNTAITTDVFKSLFLGIHSINIIGLFLSGLEWTGVQPDSFSISWKSLGKLDLSSNNIIRVEGFEFVNISETLWNLILSDNSLIEVHLRTLPKLTHLDLLNNRLTSIPNLCTVNSSTVPRLKYLTLGSNFISYFDSKSFSCLHYLKQLSLNGNSIQVIKSRTFSTLHSLQQLIINDNYRLRKIEGYAFSNPTLQFLSIQKNRIHFDHRNTDIDHLFSELPKLQVLNAGNNYFPIEREKLLRIFKPLPRLINLNLQSVGLLTIPGGLLQMFYRIETLVLLGNRIFTWDDENPFENVTSLKLLNLQSNNIKVINKTSFPPPFLTSVRHIILSHNKFSCTCDLKWFLDLIKGSLPYSNISFSPYPKAYVCDTPTSLKRISLKDYYPSEESCNPDPNNLWFIELIIVPSVLMVVALSAILVTYKCRWHIRYWIHVLRSKKSQYTRLVGDDYLYDGFVIYGDGDRQWVHNTLAQHLEAEEDIRLCLHYRDFDVGLLIVDNIDKHMLLSKKIIIVLSNDCALSEWCQFEVRIAQERHLKGDNAVLIVVMLEELEAKNMSSLFKTLITTTTYAIWTDDELGKQLFWEQVVSALKP